VSGCAIGICAALERARWGPWEDTVTMLPRSYATAVQAAGGLALLLPPDQAVAEAPDPLLDRLDALILAGGSDVDPATYGAAPHPQTGGTWPERDRFEVALARGALERDMPLLGVCRGMQIVNVALGGTLAQHLPDTLGGDQHRHTPGAFADHAVRLKPGSLAAAVAAADPADDYVVAVKSHHHQGLDELGEGLVASGWSVSDDLVEAIELPGHRFALCVLWHPEEDQESGVIASLVEATRSEVRLG
jgi:putative glutamine amidotransferase